MTIWKETLSIEQLNKACKNSMVEHVGIVFTELGEDYLTATMPVDNRTLQPFGLMHGGASAVLAETVGSFASNYCVDQKKQFTVGLDINTSHIRMATDGQVTGYARPVHLGASIHVWEVKIYNEQEKLISLNRLTTKVLSRRHHEHSPILTQREQKDGP